MAANVRSLPPEIARAAERARAAIGSLPTTAPDLTPLSPEVTAWADWAIESGELANALRRAADTDPDLAD
jgi:hypothetical protein